ncbi:radical SAM protein, partial [bacterium]
MKDLIQEARLFIEKNMGPAVFAGAPQRSSSYTKYTTDLYSYIPLPYYELHKIDGDSIFKNYPYPGKVLFYFHIPFCSYKCSFCYYYSLPRCRDDLIDRYLDCLKREMEMVNARIALSSLPTHSLHFGGGTPSYLNLRQLSFLFSSVRKIIKTDSNTCFAFETSPETILDQDKLKFLFESGVSHIDIGIQTFQEDVLSFTNRRHTPETAV